MFWIGLILGFCIGGLCGLVATALINVANEDDFWVMCSECGTEFLDEQIGIVVTYKHCPYCGVKMGDDGE